VKNSPLDRGGATALGTLIPFVPAGVARKGLRPLTDVIDDILEAAASRLKGFTDSRERAVAEFLEGLGRKVEKNPLEGAVGAGRQGDAFVDGVLHEFKSLEKGADSSTIRNVVNNSVKNGGQARNIVIDARGTGLSEEEAIRGLARAAGISRGKLENITIVGDGYVLNRSVVDQ